MWKAVTAIYRTLRNKTKGKAASYFIQFPIYIMTNQKKNYSRSGEKGKGFRDQLLGVVLCHWSKVTSIDVIPVHVIF